MFPEQLLLGIVGFSFGILSSAGVFTVFASVGLVPRFAGKLHLAGHAVTFENMIILGTFAGGVGSMFYESLQLGEWVNQQIQSPSGERIFYVVSHAIVLSFGAFAGIFIGCLALAIAEMLDSITIFARRINFKKGLSVAIYAVALGKLTGSLLYFAFALFETS